MARFPEVASTLPAIRGSVYSQLAHRIATHKGEIYPLHVGDTYLEPAAGCRMEDLSISAHPGMHRYTSPHGLPALLDAIVERTRALTGVPTEREEVLITNGATGGLGAVMMGLLDPGDEVLILAPYWPLIEGIVRSVRGLPVAVPFFGVVDSAEAALALLDARRGPRTVALYLNTPNNPSGRTIPRPILEAVIEWAKRHDLWILADEVYEDYVYLNTHIYTRPLAPERTLSVHSFSKAYGMAGNRCGYLIGPKEVMSEIRKIGTHTFYSAPTASQLAALRALGGAAGEWLAAARAGYARTGAMAARRLGVEAPEGGTFLFLDVAEHLDERGLLGFLEECAERGLFLAPGPSFGPYPTHVRICFTAAPPDVVERGVEVLARILQR